MALAAVKRIDLIFDAERDINRLSADERLRVRREVVVPLVAALESWLRTERAKLSRHAAIAKAIDYMLVRWSGFTRFLEDGRICLTNNAAERALRALAMGLSLCTSFSNIWKHWKRAYGFFATRVTFSGDRRADGLGMEIA
jgi:transposase